VGERQRIAKHGGSLLFSSCLRRLPPPPSSSSPPHRERVNPLLSESSREREREMGEPDDAVLFVGVSLVLGIASRHLLRGTRVPYTVALLILGVALGSLGENRSFFKGNTARRPLLC
jgi:hypothetical protein